MEAQQRDKRTAAWRELHGGGGEYSKGLAACVRDGV